MTCRLKIRLDVLADNYGKFVRALGGQTLRVAGVLKADGYGMGAVEVAHRLTREGCRIFFSANVAEAMTLREAQIQEIIYVFSGPLSDQDVSVYKTNKLRPVLNDALQVDRWERLGDGLPAALHIDTGMNRLGIPHDEITLINARAIQLRLVMTHLACADVPQHPMNQQQVDRFQIACAGLEEIQTSIGNSAGILNGPATQGHLVRPGIGLYGGNPYAGGSNPMDCVGVLEAQVIQTRKIKKGDYIGYGAEYQADRDMKLAVVGCGYADGIPRMLSNVGTVAYSGVHLPIIGRIAMDLTHVNISEAPQVKVGDWVEFFGDSISIEQVAMQSNTISYEVLTGINKRVSRVYV